MLLGVFLRKGISGGFRTGKNLLFRRVSSKQDEEVIDELVDSPLTSKPDFFVRSARIKLLFNEFPFCAKLSYYFR